MVRDKYTKEEFGTRFQKPKVEEDEDIRARVIPQKNDCI